MLLAQHANITSNGARLDLDDEMEAVKSSSSIHKTSAFFLILLKKIGSTLMLRRFAVRSSEVLISF